MKKEIIVQGLNIELEMEEIIVDIDNAKIILGEDPEEAANFYFTSKLDGTFGFMLSELMKKDRKYKLTIEEIKDETENITK